jgi:hypothetical protein
VLFQPSSWGKISALANEDVLPCCGNFIRCSLSPVFPRHGESHSIARKFCQIEKAIVILSSYAESWSNCRPPSPGLGRLSTKQLTKVLMSRSMIGGSSSQRFKYHKVLDACHLSPSPPPARAQCAELSPE